MRMTDATEPERPVLLPHLYYEEPNDAVAWLCRVFGFEEQSRMAGPDGTLYIADLQCPGGGSVMISGLSGPIKARMRAAFPDDFRESPISPWPNLYYAITVLVPDVDQHHEHARREGAQILAEPHDQAWGLRDYEVLDLEGRQWNFSQHRYLTKPEDWGAASSS
jgi:uncharacterized glyoxalase superfamily protein PhnB